MTSVYETIYTVIWLLYANSVIAIAYISIASCICVLPQYLITANNIDRPTAGQCRGVLAKLTASATHKYNMIIINNQHDQR